MKQNYTILTETGTSNGSHYVKHLPMAVCRSFFKRQLRDSKEESLTDYVTVQNIDTKRVYYYKVFASKYEVPISVQIGSYKTILSKYKVTILKLSKDFVVE